MHILICVYMHIYKYFYREPSVITLVICFLCIHTHNERDSHSPSHPNTKLLRVCVCVFLVVSNSL